MKIFLIILLLGYVIPTLIIGIILLPKRRRAEKRNPSWTQSTNLKELVINAQNEGVGSHEMEDSVYGIGIFFTFAPILNIFILLFLIIEGLVGVIGYIFSKIPIK